MLRNRLMLRLGLCFLAGVLLALTLGAQCGDDPSPDPTATPEPTPTPVPTPVPTLAGRIDPCTLLTREEVQGFLGQGAKEPVRNVYGKVDSCYWSGDELEMIILQTQQGMTTEEFAKIVIEALAYNIQPILVASVGEEAAWLGGTLAARKGDVYMQVTVNKQLDEAALLELSKNVLLKALERVG